MIKSSYSILFKVELLHEYFLNRQCPDFEIVPSEESKVLLNRAKIIWRNTGHKLIAFIQQNDAGEPYFNTASVKNYRKDFGAAVFRFYLKLRNPLFFNYTNINFDFTRQKKFYFSNLSQNSGPGYLFLSAPVSPFSLDRQYIPGDMVKDAQSGKVYEALKKYTSKEDTELSDPLLWLPKGLSNVNNSIPEFIPRRSYNAGDLVKQPKTDNIFEAVGKFTANSIEELKNPLLWIPRGQGQLEYANENDVIECSPGNYRFMVSNPLKKAEIMILGFNYNPASPAYDVPVTENQIKNFDELTTTVPVNLSSLQPGKYLIKINDETRVIYYDPLINAGNVFGVIEIFNFLPAGNDYSLLTEDEKIKKINYQISFAARSVLWKYIRKDGKAQTITDTGNTAYQFTLKGDGFISSSPIPLSENVLKTLTLEFSTTDFKLSPLPNPSPERFSKCNQNDYDYLCSEIYLNY